MKRKGKRTQADSDSAKQPAPQRKSERIKRQQRHLRQQKQQKQPDLNQIQQNIKNSGAPQQIQWIKAMEAQDEK